ncbi:diguanylate cyclase domain-containing protein [Paenibacillus sp. FA6]|uniref:diguanylate cyclase domain-containing protein n=1 Tax=Paenibacillus sp. FA6 TaxID=3413029 RepID=UPI003F65C44B
MISICLMVILRMMFIERVTLKRLAYLDTVTGLINRNGLDRFWNQYPVKGNMAVLFLDLDYFKDVNDEYGHQAGDQLLKEVGWRLLQVNHKGMQVFRIGGDEFIIMLPNSDLKKAELLAQAILEKFKRSFVIKGHHLSITGSIGITLRQDRKIDRLKLMEEADLAMYQAKKMGRGRYSIFNEDKSSYGHKSEIVPKQSVSS